MSGVNRQSDTQTLLHVCHAHESRHPLPLYIKRTHIILYLYLLSTCDQHFLLVGLYSKSVMASVVEVYTDCMNRALTCRPRASAANLKKNEQTHIDSMALFSS